MDPSVTAGKASNNVDQGISAGDQSIEAGRDINVHTGGIPDNELQQLILQYIPPSIDKEIGSEGGDLSVKECSLTIPPLVVAQKLSMSMLMDFENLSLPADRIHVSPYFDVKHSDKQSIPAKARIPTWFIPPEDSKLSVKIYKRYLDEENEFAWRELQNEVTFHYDVLEFEFEIDDFCGFIAMVPDWHWGDGRIKLSHALFNHGLNFESIFCYALPATFFRQKVSKLRAKGYKEIYFDVYVMKPNRSVPIRMECFDTHLHEFAHPQCLLLTPTDINSKHTLRFPFLLKHLQGPRHEADIRYIVDEFRAPFAVKLTSSKARVADVNNT